MAADGGEQAHRVVIDFGGDPVPGALLGHAVELAPEIAQVVQVQHRPVARRRAVEGDAVAHPLDGLLNLLVVRAGGDEAAAGDLEVLRVRPVRAMPSAMRGMQTSSR